MEPDDGPLVDAALALLEGEAVDWSGLEGPAARELEALAPLLRALAAPAGHDSVPPARWGHLEVRGLLGSGAFGTVYRAWDKHLEREVALKVLRADALGARGDAALDEGRRLARVRHPNVVSVYGADRFDASVGIWMEHVAGRTLADVLRAQGVFGPREAAVIGLDLCRALAAIHAAGLVHRDVKPHNVVREDGGRTVLMDLGAAGDAFGTPLFMAPEVLAGRPSTPASDVYSLGVLLFQLVTASHPVLGTTLEELRGRHARNERRLLRDVRPDLPERFVRAVERATAPAERRFQSAGALEAALAASLELPPPAPAARGIGPWVLGLTGWALALAGFGFWLRLPARVPEPLRELPPTTFAAAPSPVEVPPAPMPTAQPPTVPAADAAGPIAEPSIAPFVSESESRRAGAERVLNAALAALAQKATQAEILQRRFDDSCRGRTTRGTTVKQGPRGPYTDTFNVDNETTPACLGYSSDGQRLVAEIQAGLELAEEDARRARLLPGAFREARRRYGLEALPVWR